MKKLMLPVVLILFSTVNAFAQTNCNRSDLAEVDQFSGLYVFFQCKPVKEYTVLGSMKKALYASTMIDFEQKAAEKSKKDYPGADGIIIHSVSVESFKDSWDIIKFK